LNLIRGLGLQDEYLEYRSRFSKIDAGESNPTSLDKGNKHNIVQDGKTVFKYAVTNMADSSELIMKRITNEDVSG
jgi:3-oxoacyl-[acyl-carrier-protein] synthase-3